MLTLLPLNGWQRLFVVVAALYALIVIAVAIATAPKRSEVTRSWAWETLELLEADVKRTTKQEITAAQFRASKDLAGKDDEQVARKLAEDARSIDVTDTAKQDLARYKTEVGVLADRFEAKLKELPSEQLKHAGLALAAWLIPSTSVLVLGYATAWVIRGFRRR